MGKTLDYGQDQAIAATQPALWTPHEMEVDKESAARMMSWFGA